MWCFSISSFLPVSHIWLQTKKCPKPIFQAWNVLSRAYLCWMELLRQIRTPVLLIERINQCLFALYSTCSNKISEIIPYYFFWTHLSYETTLLTISHHQSYSEIQYFLKNNYTYKKEKFILKYYLLPTTIYYYLEYRIKKS